MFLIIINLSLYIQNFRHKKPLCSYKCQTWKITSTSDAYWYTHHCLCQVYKDAVADEACLYNDSKYFNKLFKNAWKKCLADFKKGSKKNLISIVMGFLVSTLLVNLFLILFLIYLNPIKGALCLLIFFFTAAGFLTVFKLKFSVINSLLICISAIFIILFLFV